jgi:hypothetical protein
MLGGVHNKQSRTVGGSLTDFDGLDAADGKSIANSESNIGGESNTGGNPIAGGSLADAILNRVNAPQEENIPKIDIPDTTIKETINPEEVTNTIIEQVRTMEDSSFSITGVLNTIIIYLSKIVFVGFDIENKIMHNWTLSFVWIVIAGIVFGIASGIENTNITFILYCCAIWIMALAIMFVLIHPYRSEA